MNWHAFGGNPVHAHGLAESQGRARVAKAKARPALSRPEVTVPARSKASFGHSHAGWYGRLWLLQTPSRL
eukprot:4152963-Pleurochrysis_carterae.AAC.4